MTEVSKEAAVVLDAIEKAVGRVLTEMYAGENVDNSGRLESQIEHWIRSHFHRVGLEIQNIVFTKGRDEDGAYCLQATVSIVPQAEDIIIEFAKVLRSAVDDGFDN
jgi:hypothetical protein